MDVTCSRLGLAHWFCRLAGPALHPLSFFSFLDQEASQDVFLWLRWMWEGQVETCRVSFKAWSQNEYTVTSAHIYWSKWAMGSSPNPGVGLCHMCGTLPQMWPWQWCGFRKGEKLGPIIQLIPMGRNSSLSACGYASWLGALQRCTFFCKNAFYTVALFYLVFKHMRRRAQEGQVACPLCVVDLRLNWDPNLCLLKTKACGLEQPCYWPGLGFLDVHPDPFFLNDLDSGWFFFSFSSFMHSTPPFPFWLAN